MDPDGPPGSVPGGPRDSVAFFLSGHSLTDDPLADDIVTTATSLGLEASYNEQIVLGSPIRVRTRGAAGGQTGWDGYSTGKNRGGGSGLNVIAELATPATIEGPYDTLIITERHDLVNTLIWEDTVKFVRHFHDRLVDGNPRGITYVYHSWLSVQDRDDPSGFIAYERAIYPAWECVAERVHVSLAAEGSSSEIVPLPAGIALTDLVELAVAGDVEGLSESTTSATIDRIFADAVHLTPLGAYYVSLVTFATVYRRSPIGASPPAGIDPGLAARLQAIAWDSVSRHFDTDRRGMAACRAYMRDVACDAFGDYMDSPSAASACHNVFGDDYVEGPFRYDAATDADYWYPSP